MTGGTDERALQAVAARALDLVADGARVGLGSGRAAAAFIAQLGERVRQGLRVAGVPTSEASARQARDLGIPLIDLGEDVELELTVDGADEVAPNLDLVKGRGGALVRERIVASASRRQVIPLARGPATRRLGALGLRPAVRADRDGAQPLLTENGNLTLDCALAEPLRDARAARELEATLLAIPGVVDTGLFLGTAERVLVGYPDGRVDVLRPEGR